MIFKDFPPLYCAADEQSGNKQRSYFRLLLAQYLCLFFASVLTLSTVFWDAEFVIWMYSGLLMIGAVAALTLGSQELHQKWYRLRALAESCKTLSWRYMMRDLPFGQIDEKQADAALADRFLSVLEFHRPILAPLIEGMTAEGQATSEMKRVRGLDYAGRKSIYLEYRIEDQLNWYTKKARANRRTSKVASAMIVAIYVIAIVTAVVQVEVKLLPNQIFWVSEPLLVLAASVLGFAQAKRYAELSESYALTAFEIESLKSRFLANVDEAGFTEIVGEAETAFSREHTQWLARVG